MEDERNYLSVVEFHKMYADIEDQKPNRDNKISRFINKRKKIRQKKKLIDIIYKIPEDRPRHTEDLNEYLHFINSTNLPTGNFGIVKKSIDNYSDLNELGHKRSIYAEFELIKFDLEQDSKIITGSINIEESSDIELDLRITIDGKLTARHWILDRLEKQFPSNADNRDKLASECLTYLNKALIRDMRNFLIDIITVNDKEIEKYDCICGESNSFFRNYLGFVNFIIDNHNLLNHISIINNIFDRFKNIGKKVYIETNSTSLKPLLDLDYKVLCLNEESENKQLKLTESYLIKFAQFLEKMKSVGYQNDSSCEAWSEISNDNVDLYIKNLNGTTYHFSYTNLHVESLIIKSSNSILSFLDEDQKEKNIYSVRYEETFDSLDEPFAKLDYRKQNDEICYTKDDLNVDIIFTSKMLFTARRLYMEMLEDIPKFMGISESKLPVEEILDGKRVYITKSIYERNSH